MRQGLSLTAFGHATSLFLATTFVLCVGFDLLFPAHAMTRYGNTCFRDSSGSVGRVSFWGPSKAMGTAGTRH